MEPSRAIEQTTAIELDVRTFAGDPVALLHAEVNWEGSKVRSELAAHCPHGAYVQDVLIGSSSLGEEQTLQELGFVGNATAVAVFGDLALRAAQEAAESLLAVRDANRAMCPFRVLSGFPQKFAVLKRCVDKLGDRPDMPEMQTKLRRIKEDDAACGRLSKPSGAWKQPLEELRTHLQGGS